MAGRPAPRPKAKSNPQRPSAAHSVSARPYRNVIGAVQQNKATGTGAGASVPHP